MTNFARIFGDGRNYGPARRLRKADDRQLSIADLTDEQLDRLEDQLDDEVVYDGDGNRSRRSDLDKKGKPPMEKLDTLKAYVKSKDGGLQAICKHICDGKPVALSEHDFAQLVAVDAERDRRAGESKEQAFSRRFCAADADGVQLRKAHAIVKGTMVMPIMPVYAGGNSVDVNDPEDALAQLEELVRQMRAASPEMAKLSKEQVFAKIYADPANARLAQAERRQNRPRAG